MFNDKSEEMFDDRAWYLFARSTALEDAGKLLAFSHFRFDMDYDDEVLYVYEIQLEECAKRKGLGKFMMQVSYLEFEVILPVFLRWHNWSSISKTIKPAILTLFI